VVDANKKYYEHYSKFGKTIAKEVASKPEYEQPFFPDYVVDKTALNETIAEHMFRSGYYQSGELFTEEVNKRCGTEGVPFVNEEYKAKFKVLYLIVKEMREGVLSGAKAWAKEHLE
jgi:hypothetical protein